MKILQVDKDGIGYELGLQVGNVLVGFDGKAKVDFIDYEYYNAQESFVMSVDVGTEIVDFEVEKDIEEDLGLVFDDVIKIKQCHNKCPFCFIDQNPPGVRKSLHIKDDDYRMSMMSGTFVTLTNLKEEDITRIITYGISPLYVSVHSTDTEVRRILLGNNRAKNIMPILEVFAAHGIVIHAQIVYCPCINDDYIKTVKELSAVVASTAIVPVGLTKYSNNGILSVTQNIALKVIRSIEELQEAGYKVYCSDEMYYRANLPLPPFESYGQFEQISNGVGIVAHFENEFKIALKDIDRLEGNHTIITGVLASGMMQNIAKMCNDKGATVQVIAVDSIFFGGDVSCAGLVVGSDILKACQGIDLTNQDSVIIPKTMLKEFGDVFLDDMPLQELENKLRKRITVCAVDGVALVSILSGLSSCVSNVEI